MCDARLLTNRLATVPDREQQRMTAVGYDRSSSLIIRLMMGAVCHREIAVLVSVVSLSTNVAIAVVWPVVVVHLILR